MQFSQKIVTLIILMNMAFAAVVLYVFLQTGNEPAALVGCWFAFTTGELWALSKIRIKKEENNHDRLETKTSQPPFLDGDRRLRDGDSDRL